MLQLCLLSPKWISNQQNVTAYNKSYTDVPFTASDDRYLERSLEIYVSFHVLFLFQNKSVCA